MVVRVHRVPALVVAEHCCAVLSFPPDTPLPDVVLLAGAVFSTSGIGSEDCTKRATEAIGTSPTKFAFFTAYESPLPLALSRFTPLTSTVSPGFSEVESTVIESVGLCQ